MRINLTGGSLEPRTPLLSAQRCLNLYPEPIPDTYGESVTWACYPRGGLKAVYTSQNNFNRPVRGMYKTSQGDLIVCIGSEVIRLNSDFSVDVIGTIQDGTTQVRMVDNALTLFIVDGNPNNGWYASIPTTIGGQFGSLQQINDPAFYGSQTISIIDTYFLFTKPNSNNWYCSLSNFTNDTQTPFYALYIASKTSKPDFIVAIQSLGQFVFIFGMETTEVWYNAGEQAFPFLRCEGLMIGYGLLAPYSLIVLNNKIFFLGRDFKGWASLCCIVERGCEKITPFWLERIFQEYGDLENTIAYGYQLNGHNYVQLTFSNGKVWCLDADLNVWHERCTLDANGDESQFRGQAFQSAYNMLFSGDFQNGIVYLHSNEIETDNGVSIKYQRSFPHVVQDSKQIRHKSLTLDMQSSPNLSVNIDYSDDRGETYCLPISVQYNGQGSQWAKVWHLGVSRDRVYRVTWQNNNTTALLGAFLDVDVFGY